MLASSSIKDASSAFLIDADILDPSEIKSMIIVNTAAINFLEFDASIYDYLDALSDAKIDVYNHLMQLHEVLLEQ